MFNFLTYKKMLKLYRGCLQYGIAEQADQNYKCLNNPSVLIINREQRYLGLFYLGEPMGVLHYEDDNYTWKSLYIVRIGKPIEKYRVMIDLEEVFEQTRAMHNIRPIRTVDKEGGIL